MTESEMESKSETEQDESPSDIDPFISDFVGDCVSVDEPWMSKNRIVSEARKHDDLDHRDVSSAIQRLNGDAIVHWHGLVTSTEPDVVRQLIQDEVDSRVTRKTLIGRFNVVLEDCDA
jgi:hypothetical protein